MVVRFGFASDAKKIVFVGAASAGKSALIQKYITGTFTPDYQQTFGAEMFMKTTTEVKKHSLQLLSCGGHERYRTLLGQFFNDATVVVICFDMLSIPSFQEIGFWYNEAKRNVPDVIVVLVGTKADEADSANVKIQDVMKLSKDWGVEFKTVSSKTGQNVDELFDYILTKLP